MLQTTMPPRYRTFEHTADVGLRAYGATTAEAFGAAAQGLFSVITDLRRVRPAQAIDVSVESAALDTLLVEWLNELLFYWDSRRFLMRAFVIELRERSSPPSWSLQARCMGEPLDEARHEAKMDVKAVTYHAASVVKATSGWRAEVILDV